MGIAGALPEAVSQHGLFGELTKRGVHTGRQGALAIATFENGGDFSITELIGCINQESHELAIAGHGQGTIADRVVPMGIVSCRNQQTIGLEAGERRDDHLLIRGNVGAVVA